MSTKVLFVCTGNICRSPMAEAIMRHQVQARALAIEVRSAGTGNWHVGEPPDSRAAAMLRQFGVACDGIHARQVSPTDLQWADYVLALDASHLRALRAMGSPAQKTHLLLDFAPAGGPREVGDPYYDDSFENAYRLIEAGVLGLIARIEADQRG